MDGWEKEFANGKLVIKGNANIKDLKFIALVGPVYELVLENCRNVTLQGIEELKDSLKILRVSDCDLKELDGVEKV